MCTVKLLTSACIGDAQDARVERIVRCKWFLNFNALSSNALFWKLIPGLLAMHAGWGKQRWRIVVCGVNRRGRVVGRVIAWSVVRLACRRCVIFRYG